MAVDICLHLQHNNWLITLKRDVHVVPVQHGTTQHH